MQDGGNIVVVSGLLIGLAYGAVGLLSGFCLLSGLRGWWANGDSRLIRTYALALGRGDRRHPASRCGQHRRSRQIDLSAAVVLGAADVCSADLLFGYGMVLSNGCGSRALVLLGRGNLRSFVVVIVLGIAAQMTLERPDRAGARRRAAVDPDLRRR